ncbi:GTP-dependent dephospho-CoA kinase family protein [Halorubellus sp. PRR65]|uniref:GTP-dependent dephospho-CoA kinase family protein n=1 Tax=Halorubellus sp. PRR65 TaxID=3098148 RepID=UPI002B25EBBC|nr:GTP-dependent dephospho-CoA kinase family protein [Halorubellus sp. PRR65]
MSAAGDGGSEAVEDVLLTLPESLRSAFKEPFGPVETDADALLADVDGPLVAVGDIVTYHLLQADRQPDVAVVDEHTKREVVDDAVRDAVVDPDVTVSNPAGALSAALVRALGDALATDDATTVFVDGEEDLAVLPAVMVAPVGASVVYGQPDAGMVHVPVTEETKAEFRALIERMDGDLDAFWAVVADA